MSPPADPCVTYGHHRLSTLRTAIREDILRFATFTPRYRPELNIKTTLSIFLKPTILCLSIYRFGHYLHVCRWRRIAVWVSRFNQLLHKACITPQSCIGPACFLGHGPGTFFHGRAGRNLTLFSLAICCPKEDAFGGPLEHAPLLGNNVALGAHAVVLGPITVGDNVKLAPGTILDVNCPADTVVASLRVLPRFERRGL